MFELFFMPQHYQKTTTMRLLCMILLSLFVLTAKAQIPATGNVLWLKADAAVFNDAGITASSNGQTVQQWNDQSGNGNNVTQTVAANKPVFQMAQIGGRPSIFFDGVGGTKFLNNVTQDLVASGGARTTIIVGKISAGAPVGGTMFTYRRTALINSLSIGLYSGLSLLFSTHRF